MTSKEFKRINHFRGTGDRSCLNCKYCVHEMIVLESPYGELSKRKNYCINDYLDNSKCKFVISNFTICDNWESNKN